MPSQKEVRNALLAHLENEGWGTDPPDPAFREKIADILQKEFDGVWSYGTVRMIQDLAAFYSLMEGAYGAPPDKKW